MLSDKSVLLERINIAITKKWGQKDTDIFDHLPDCELTSRNPAFTEKDYFTHSRNAASIERLEERIEALENLQDQLFCFINFLVERFPDLVINILHANQEKKEVLVQEDSSCQSNEGSAGKNCSQNKNEPCPTRREKDILDLLEKGLCAKEIANRLYISETTVITHKKNLKEKFNARNTVELISKVQQQLSRK